MNRDLSLFNSICADFEDILPNDLHGPFSEILGSQYLQEAFNNSPQKHIRGIVWGSSLRPIITFHVQISDSILTLTGSRYPIHIHFLYLPVSPQTFLSDEALRALGIEDMVVVGEPHKHSSLTSLRLPLKINGHLVPVARSPSDTHFAHLNILGQDFIQHTGATVFFGGQTPRFEITFP
ncbi:hypothetical protein BGZ49_010779 [Haplosporangium sp. Z 27]|nr:hypothetical protein BGZ49_010779 [Haplosporangium sp. Z 27]